MLLQKSYLFYHGNFINCVNIKYQRILLCCISSKITTKHASLISTDNDHFIDRKQSNVIKPSSTSFRFSRYQVHLTKLTDFVEDIFHLKDVREAQLKVLHLRDELKQCSDNKREILNDINEIRKSLQNCHDEIFTTKRGTERFLHLLKEESSLIKIEEQKMTEFTKADQSERNFFNTLTDAINTSYEKEKIHANTLKMWAIIGTLFGSFVSLLISFLGYYHHNMKIEKTLNDLEKHLVESNKINHKELEDLIGDILEKKSIVLQKASKVNSPPSVVLQQESWISYLFIKPLRFCYRHLIPWKQSPGEIKKYLN